MTLSTPGGGGIFAGQELREETENNEMKPEATLPGITLHDPVKNVAEGFAGHGDRKNFLVRRRIKAARRII